MFQMVYETFTFKFPGFRCFSSDIFIVDDTENMIPVKQFTCYMYLTQSNQLCLNPFQPTDVFWCICSRRLLKPLCQKEKLLKTSFCKIVFKVVCCRLVVSIIILSFKEIFNIFFKSHSLVFRCRLFLCRKSVNLPGRHK